MALHVYGQSHNEGDGHTRFLTKLAWAVKVAFFNSPSIEPATCNFSLQGELE